MDPITFALIFGAALWVTDTASSGLVRAELWGGASGAVRGAGREWLGRRVRSHKRRQKARSKTHFGRVVNAMQDEAKAYARGVRTGWPEGRARAHAKRRERWATKAPWWKRVFGPSEPPNDEPEQDVDDPNGEPEHSADPWGDPDPVRTEGAERFRLDVHLRGAQKPSNSGAWVARLPKDEAVENAEEWARSIMSQLMTADTGLLYRTTSGTDERVGAFAGQNDPTGDQPAATAPTRGTSTMTDISTAPAAIAAWQAIKDRFEEIKSLVDVLELDASSAADGMGDFGVGSEPDAAQAIGTVSTELVAAEEAVDAVLADLHEEWDEHIAAAEGRAAAAHAPFQEV